MKAVFTFDLPEENEDHKIFSNARELHSALWEIYQRCRREWKYNEAANDESIAIADEIYDLIPTWIVE